MIGFMQTFQVAGQEKFSSHTILSVSRAVPYKGETNWVVENDS